MFIKSIKSKAISFSCLVHKKGNNSPESRCREVLFYYYTVVEFIKMILVIYKAHFSSQYQIVIISNSWKWFFVFCLRSCFDFNLCIWLSFALFSFSVCIFIANANELVGKSCVIKVYFQWISNHARNATLFLGNFRGGRAWCMLWRECGKEKKRQWWQRILRIIKLFFCSILLPKFTFLLPFFAFLIDYSWFKVK